MALKFGQKLKNIIGTVAPVLGASLGGPLGGLAGRLLKEKLGAETDEAALAILETPEGLAKAKEAEAELKLRAKELDIDLEAVHQKDRDSARQREAAVRDFMPQALGITVMAGFIAMAAAVLFGYAVTDSTVAGTIIGFMSAKAEQVVSYYFGSSSGSKAKTDLLAGK